MRVLLFDNYDSFTYNIAHLLRDLEVDFDVYRNDKIPLEDIQSYDKIILSPGPGIPSEAGILTRVIERYAKEKSILGICLGHQAIGEVFGAKLMLLPNVFHGISTMTQITREDYLMHGMPDAFRSGRYHSWVIDPSTVPLELEVTSIDEDDEIMSVRHTALDIRGVQFHPESILTEQGKTIIENFIKGPHLRGENTDAMNSESEI